MLFGSHPYLGKRGCIPLSIRLLCFGYIRHYSIGAECCCIPWSSILLGVFHQVLQLSYFIIFLCSESNSSYLNSPCLISNLLLIIIVIGLCVIFGGFLSKFSKCWFHKCIRSSWLVAFSLAFAVLFFLLTSFTVCHSILDCISSTESLILLIRFCMYSVCSLRHTLANSFCAFLIFRALILVGFLQLYWESVFTSVRFFLTANVSHVSRFSSLFIWYAFCCLF